jgi:hypothetical protein
MNIQLLREAQARFQTQMEHFEAQRAPMHKRRREFTRQFSLEKLGSLPKEQYVLGLERTDQVTFCYGMEYQLDDLGATSAGNAYKFGVYFGRTKADPTKKYRFAKKSGENVDEAYAAARSSIISLIQAGKAQDLTALTENNLSVMFKGKTS